MRSFSMSREREEKEVALRLAPSGWIKGQQAKAGTEEQGDRSIGSRAALGDVLQRRLARRAECTVSVVRNPGWLRKGDQKETK